MNKIYLAISTSSTELANLTDLTSVFEHFDGLCVTYHGNPEEDAYKLLCDRKKGGFVECLSYKGHHGHDLNNILFNPIIKLNDLIILRDSSERISNSFASNIRPFVRHITNLGVNTIYQRSKLLMFRRFIHQEFKSTPHWNFVGAQDKKIQIDETNWFQKDEDYAYSLRKERAPFSWVDHYVRYYLITESNHQLLGLENFGNPAELFPKLEIERLNFLLYLQELGTEQTVDGLKNHILNNDLDDTLNYYFNNVRVLNDFYQYHKLGNKDLIDDIGRKCIKID